MTSLDKPISFITSTDYDEEYIYLNAKDLGLDILVKTSHKKFQEDLELMEAESSLEECKKLMCLTWIAIKEATKNGIDKVFNVEPEWSDLCDDIAIFYSYRWIIFKKPVPITRASTVQN